MHTTISSPRGRTRHFLAAATVVLLTSVGFVASAPAQAAATLEVNYGVPSNGDTSQTDAIARNDYAWGAFEKNGDRFFIFDSYPDNMRVAVHWKLKDGSRQGICINKGGGIWKECNKNLPENKTVLIRVGRCDGDAHSCEVLGNYVDWSAYDSSSTS